MSEAKLHNNHWQTENFKQRMTRNQWRDILLNHDDKMVFRGQVRQLKARPLGAGVVEVSKKSLVKNDQ